MNELKIDPDPETEIVRAGSVLSSPSFLCIFDGDRAEIHTAASFSKAYPDYSEVTSSLEELSGENCFSLQKERPKNVSWDEAFDQSRPVFIFRDGQITIERVV